MQHLTISLLQEQLFDLKEDRNLAIKFHPKLPLNW